MFFKKNIQTPYIIVGLGNPEKKYDNTRHNIGFDAIDFIAEQNNIKISKSKFSAIYGTGEINGEKVCLLKPLTYMNLSGNAVSQAANFFKTPAEKIIILCDDISLPVGKARLREKGSAGGHNGLKSIISHFGENFIRIKIGVGEKPNKEYDLADWVLGKFSTAEKEIITQRFKDINQSILHILDSKINLAVNVCNKGN